eukprot:g28822.t1
MQFAGFVGQGHIEARPERRERPERSERSERPERPERPEEGYPTPSQARLAPKAGVSNSIDGLLDELEEDGGLRTQKTHKNSIDLTFA